MEYLFQLDRAKRKFLYKLNMVRGNLVYVACHRTCHLAPYSMDSSYSIRVRRFMTNPLLKRRQFCLEVIHPGKPCVNKEKLKEKIAKQFKLSDPKTIILYGFKTLFGGGRSTGFGLIYDNIAAVKGFEKSYRLVRNGLKDARTKTGRRALKELKNRRKKVRGKDKAKCSSAGKKK